MKAGKSRPISKSTALTHCLGGNNIFAVNNTATLVNYHPAPDSLEKGYNAKVTIPVYRILKEDGSENAEEYTVDAFIAVFLKNPENKRLFNEEELSSDPLINFIRSYAIHLANLGDEIDHAKFTLMQMAAEKLKSAKGYANIVDRRAS